MANDTFDYARLLNDIDTKMDALQTLRGSVLAASASGALGQPLEGTELPLHDLPAGRNGGVPTELPEGAFNGKSVPACIELYLSSAPMKKRTNKEIAAALHEGGVESNASKFDTIIAGALFKLKKDGKILRFKDGWGLSEWYPPHIRGASDTGSSGKRAKKKKGKRTEKKNAQSKSTTAAQLATATESMPREGNAGDRIIELLRAKPEHEHRLEEVAEHTGLGVKFARLTLGKLVKAGRAKVSAPGVYTIGRPQLVAASM